MNWTWRWVVILLWSSASIPGQARGACFPAIFNFGDNEGDTGGLHASFPNTTVAEFPPYGQTYFGKPQGRGSDGRLIVDFIAQAYGLRYVDPYLQSVTSDFSQGANFASYGVLTATSNNQSPFPLPTQVLQFVLFQQEVLAILNETSAILASSGMAQYLSDVAQQFQLGVQPYKKLYNDLFNTATTNGTAANQTSDPALQRTLAAAQRLPSADYFQQGLYLISIGTNDLKAGVITNQTPDQIMAAVPAVVTAITTGVQDLYNAGARNILVSGVGTIGCAPWLLEAVPHTKTDLDNWGCLASYNTIARSYNVQLQQKLEALTPDLPSANIAYLDSYQMQHNLLFNYTESGFVDPIKACCGVPSDYNYDPQVLCGQSGNIANVLYQSVTCTDPGTYVVWDGLAYTEAANQYFAKQIFSGQFVTPLFPFLGSNCTLQPIA